MSGSGPAVLSEGPHWHPSRRRRRATMAVFRVPTLTHDTDVWASGLDACPCIVGLAIEAPCLCRSLAMFMDHLNWRRGGEAWGMHTASRSRQTCSIVRVPVMTFPLSSLILMFLVSYHAILASSQFFAAPPLSWRRALHRSAWLICDIALVFAHRFTLCTLPVALCSAVMASSLYFVTPPTSWCCAIPCCMARFVVLCGAASRGSRLVPRRAFWCRLLWRTTLAVVFSWLLCSSITSPEYLALQRHRARRPCFLVT
ncbi:hypothetical protein K438DRAFT_846028 [Mycena galopus ATCC 62051]|nr:hypothetical protein K438DRAFT_846028 [Mycena galopus ATCC 62051]